MLPAAHRQHVDHRTRSPSRTPWRLTSRRVTHELFPRRKDQYERRARGEKVIQ
jgi:hypothetical protein